MARSERDALAESALPAALVTRSDLPVPLAHPARSFFGGLPKLPPAFEWPRADVRANEKLETVALSFVAQIDLADLPRSIPSPLPKVGTLYFFCSSVFVGEDRPPCRVLYSPAHGGAYAERSPPPDLMPLGGSDGDAQVKWLDPAVDFHSRVEFKYPLSFQPFTDFYFHEDPVGGELFVESLCRALGPGEPKQADLLQFRAMDAYAKDEDWPFNWLLMTYVVRSVLSLIQDDFRPRSYKPLGDQAATELRRLRAGAIRWLERCRTLTSLDRLEADAKAGFRSWWFDVAQTYERLDEQVFTYPHKIPANLGYAINHTVRCMATQDPEACDDVPHEYIANLARQNHWKTPTVKDGQYRHFSTALHQMLGYGSGPQDATEEHLEDILLLQIGGDLAFFDWHANIGCVLHFWIDPDALARLDFSNVVATYECD
ncbi:DUF1963 domain-containing protein [Bradyrhizobium sp. UFLA05-109]